MRRALQELTLLATVVAIALAVWFVISDAETREVETRLGFSLTVEVLDLASDLAVVGEPLPVSVTVVGREGDVDAARPEEFEASISLRNRVAGQHSVPVRVETTSSDVRVRAVLPETVVVTLQETIEREVPVIVEPRNPPPLGFRVGLIEVTPGSAVVSGIAREVQAVSSIVARVDLAGATAPIQRDVTLEARTTTGVVVSQVVLNPRFAHVEVPIEQELFRRRVAVLPQVVGTPADGYRIRSVNAEPPTLDVLVPVDVLDDAIEVETVEIDVSEQAGDFTQVVGLILEEGVSAASEAPVAVEVQVSIEPVLSTVTLPVEVQIASTPAGLSAAFVSVQFVRAELRGAIAEIVALSGPLPPILVNLSAYSEGRHRIDLRWAPPSGFDLVELRPSEVIVMLSPVPAPQVPTGGPIDE